MSKGEGEDGGGRKGRTNAELQFSALVASVILLLLLSLEAVELPLLVVLPLAGVSGKVCDGKVEVAESAEQSQGRMLAKE